MQLDLLDLQVLPEIQDQLDLLVISAHQAIKDHKVRLELLVPQDQKVFLDQPVHLGSLAKLGHLETRGH